MNRYHLLAAEIYGYSYANYDDHLGVNIRFDKLMPDDVKTLEKADAEGWPLERLARALEGKPDDAAAALAALRRAREVVDAANPAEAFRNAARQVIKSAVARGITDDDAIEKLVVQICYRAADLAFLLERDKTPLSRYSEDLRREPDLGAIDADPDEDD
jgi:hypothetical protein